MVALFRQQLFCFTKRRMSDLKPESVSNLFDKGLSFYHDLCNTLEPSNNVSYQVSVTFNYVGKLF